MLQYRKSWRQKENVHHDNKLDNFNENLLLVIPSK